MSGARAVLGRRGVLAAGAVLGGAALTGAAGTLDRLLVRGRQLTYGDRTVRCTVGFGGIRVNKREGDGGTPAGVFPLRRVLFRPDRVIAPETLLRVQALLPGDGWCDDPADPAYNRLVRLPYPAHYEALWRDDALYDVVVPLGANDAPPIPGRGSAIFLHVARADWGPTDGCVAVERAALLAILRQCGRATVIDIRA